MLDSDASTAKTLTLVAIILQIVFFAIGIFAILASVALFAVTSTTTTSSVGLITTSTSSLPVVSYFGIFSIVFSGFFIFGLVWILLDYFLVYKKLERELVRDAETPSLVLGILQLIFGGVIPGILLIIAYVKIRDSIERSSNLGPGVPQN